MADEATGGSSAYEGIDGRGTDMGRILSLSDGVFGFSMTLLVVTIALPTVLASGTPVPLTRYLSNLLPALLSYALAFVVVAQWWGEHHRVFSAIRRYDSTLTQQNNMFLLLISVTPFILSVVHVYGPSGFTDMRTAAKISVALFAGIEGLTGLLLYRIWRHATVNRLLVDRNLPDAWIRYGERQSLRSIGIFAVSAVIGLLVPLVGELLWIVSPIIGRRARAFSPRSAPPAASPPPSAPLPAGRD